MPVVHFATESYPSKSAPVESQRVINMYAEREPPDAKTPVAVFGSPGLTEFVTTGIGPVRGKHVMNGLLYAVSGSELYSIDEDGNTVLLGTGITGTNNVVMDDNNTQLVIVSNPDGWLYALSGPGSGATAKAILGGDNAGTIATGLANLVNGNSALITAGVVAGANTSSGSVYLFSPTGLATVWSKTNGSTDTITLTVNSTETATISGTITSGDKLTLTATSGSLTGSPINLVYTVASTDTLSSIATGIAGLINSNSVLSTSGLFSFTVSAIVYIFYPSTLSISWSQSVTGTEVITLGTGVSTVGVIGGVTSENDTLVLTATSGSIVGSPISVTYNIQVSGSITSINPLTNGINYTSAMPPHVVITDANGKFAQVTAVVDDTTGGVTSYQVNEGGENYSNPTVTIVNGGFFHLNEIAQNFQGAVTVTFFDNYFVFNKPNSNIFFISFLNDGTQYNGLDFATASVHSGNLLALINDHELLYLFCQKHIEVWYDSGATDFPFQRYDGATIERGLLAPLSITQQDQGIFFLGDDKIFYRLQAPLPIRVSTHGVEDAWEKYSQLSDCTSFTYVFEGHRMVVLNFPSGTSTWNLDVTTGMWHERISYDSGANPYNRWRGNCTPQFQVYNMVLIGDLLTGKLGYLDNINYTEYNNPMIGTAVSSPIHSDRFRLFMSLFELDMQVGVGVPSGQGDDPQIMLDWSDDGGMTFKPLQLWRSLGKIGKYLTRVRWLRMGSFRQRILRINISDPVRRTIIQAHTQTVKGTN